MHIYYSRGPKGRDSPISAFFPALRRRFSLFSLSSNFGQYRGVRKLLGSNASLQGMFVESRRAPGMNRIWFVQREHERISNPLEHSLFFFPFLFTRAEKNIFYTFDKEKKLIANKPNYRWVLISFLFRDHSLRIYQANLFIHFDYISLLMKFFHKVSTAKSRRITHRRRDVFAEHNGKYNENSLAETWSDFHKIGSLRFRTIRSREQRLASSRSRGMSLAEMRDQYFAKSWRNA